jgi:hypothetical protein
LQDHVIHVEELEHGVRWTEQGGAHELPDLETAAAEINRRARGGAIDALLLEPGPRWTVQDVVTLCRAWLDTLPDAEPKLEACALSPRRAEGF